MPRIQEWIYQLEVGNLKKYISIAAVVLAVVGITVIYNMREYENFSSVESMEVAQLARNIATGQGYSTHCIRPLDLHVLKRLLKGERPDTGAVFNKPVPDLANAPVYPVLLAAVMKVLPFDYDVLEQGKFDTYKYQPEVFIGWINQVIFFANVALVFLLGRRLWDSDVAILSAAIFFGTDLMWKFSNSGQSTMLLIFLFLVLCHLVTSLDHHMSGEEGSRGRVFGIAAGIGAVVGLMALTRYSMIVVIVPVLVALILVGGNRRLPITLVSMLVAICVVTPWLVRNHQVSGNLFGTAGYAVMQGTDAFPGDVLERSLDPDWGKIAFSDYTKKLMINLGDVVVEGIPLSAGGWIGGFFLVGLLPFRSPLISRLRLFVLAAVVCMIPVQCLVQTYRSELSPVLNSENLLVIFTPLLILFGVSLFFILLDRLDLPETGGARRFFSILFAMVMCAPILLAILPPRTFPIAQKHYVPPRIQSTALYLEANQVMMTDIPWATAWYGGRKSIMKSLDPSKSFEALNHYLFYQSISLLYLTELSVDQKILSELKFNGQRRRDQDGNLQIGWGTFVMDILGKQEIPTGFELRHSTGGYLPNQILLAEHELQ